MFVFAGEATYRSVLGGRGPVTFELPRGGTLTVDESGLVVFHRRTLAYVLGSAPTPARLSADVPLFSESESAHLADVRSLFGAVRLLWYASAVALAALIVFAWRRRTLFLMARDGAIASAAAVLALALVAAFAFEPAFLAFHYVFFPQGNFLFDPATSSLLALYPEEYWYGVTLRVGVSFIVLALLVAIGSGILARRSPTGGSAIVTRP